MWLTNKLQKYGNVGKASNKTTQGKDFKNALFFPVTVKKIATEIITQWRLQFGEI